eukprot:g11167.t1
MAFLFRRMEAALHQTLTFVEDEDVEMPGEIPSDKLAEVCLYVLSMEKLKEAYHNWQEAETCREFCFSRCVDPIDKKIVLELRHRIRAPEHVEWPIPRD